jgi:hypothetical protein
MRSIAIFVLSVLFASVIDAAPLAPPVRTEIDALLLRLQESRCQFNRNGFWYTAAEAKAHLLRKLEYLEGSGEVQSSEQFINLAASKSSFSGQAYRVKCGDAESVESALWLSGQLKAIRAPARAAASAPM